MGLHSGHGLGAEVLTMKGFVVLVAACVLLASAGCALEGPPTRPAPEGGSPFLDFFIVAGQTILYVVGAAAYGLFELGCLILEEAIFGSDDDDDEDTRCSTCNSAYCTGHAQSSSTSTGKAKEKPKRQVAPLLKKKP